MRKLFTPVCIFFCGLFIISCNNSETDKKETTATDTSTVKKEETGPIRSDEIDCKTIGNFLISRKVADSMTKHFNKTFNHFGLNESFWVDSCTILSLKRFLKNNAGSGYDGFRIHSIANSISSEIVFCPTKEGAYPTRHTDDWSISVPLSSACDAVVINLKPSVRERRLKRFRENFRKETPGGGVHSGKIDSLSRAVWFSTCVIEALSKYLSDAAYDLDGIRIFCGAYNRYMENSGQKKDNQSTFIIVVTRSDGANGHDNAWDVLQKIYHTDEKFNSGGYNHGQLCPDSCG